jgi:hypothetical protein
MRDASEAILYVGKARNLRKRLGSYRVANADRLPRRHLRLLRMVARIDLQECADETSALARESELLRLIRPRFNRAGIWPAADRFLAWRCLGKQLEFTVTATVGGEASGGGWQCHGPLGRGVYPLQAALARLIRIAVEPGSAFSRLPVGWSRGRITCEVTIHCGPAIETVVRHLEQLLSGRPADFCEWIRAALPGDAPQFDRAAVESDLEFVANPPLMRSVRLEAGSETNGTP